jgi:thiamine-phosphate pyrophosphorylase
MAKRIGRFHVLTDFFYQQRFSHADLARMAVEGGADTIQFRQKHGDIRHRLREARRAAGCCTPGDTTFIVNDDLPIVLATGAAGVHLGQSDFPVEEARRILGPDLIIGATASTPDQARRARDLGADYIGFGPVYATASKANPEPVKGVRGLARACEAVEIPVIAIAGITAERVRAVMEAGAWGVAVMTAVTAAEDPVAAARAFRMAIDDMLRPARASA